MPVVEIVVDVVDVELAADALWQAGPSAVEEHDLGGGQVRLRADVADGARVDLRWAPRLVVLDPADLAADLDAWRAFAAPVRAGRGVVLHPAWQPQGAAEPDELVVLLDPGRTFGSGSHPSTRLVVGLLEDLVVADQRVLDVGTGSGVLAVVAALLGAGEVVGTDVDPAVPEAVAANAAANAVGDRVTVCMAPMAEIEGPFDLVLANIGLGVLCGLASEISEVVDPAGQIVLAGLLDHQVDTAVETYAPWAEVERRSEGGWSAVVLRGR